MKKIVMLITVALSINFTGCSTNTNSLDNNKQVKSEKLNTSTTKNYVDYSNNFQGINGCAVFYSPSENTYNIYNKSIVNEEISPYSTFKIINSLMGLSQGVVTSPNSKLGYDGTTYLREQWNKDITFEEAFKESCVWYYEKIMNSLDKEYVQKTLDNLDYGNKDISAWNEEKHNTYWISSSLKISPMQQIKVLETVFENKSLFDTKDINIVKDFMLIESNENYSVYGKTGSAKDTNSWFTGFMEKDNERTYFAIRIKDESQKLAGSIARDITFDIIKQYYL